MSEARDRKSSPKIIIVKLEFDYVLQKGSERLSSLSPWSQGLNQGLQICIAYLQVKILKADQYELHPSNVSAQ
jgi:hypothetical protein